MTEITFIKHRVPGRKLYWMRDTKIKLFMQMEPEAYRDGCI